MTLPGLPADDELVEALRAAGCVFAEDEAAALRSTSSSRDDIARMLARRIAGEPLEQIVGWVDVLGLRLAVAEHVFVPRQRTGFIMQLAAERCAALTRPRMLEAFCGVAPIAAAVLARVPRAEVHALDIDAAAIECARRNLDDRGALHLGPAFTALPASLRGGFDVIAAVPPYVPATAAHLLPAEARDHEPRSALIGGEDGLDAVRAVVELAPSWLTPGGVVLLEMHREQAELASAFAAAAGCVPSILLSDDGHTAVLELTYEAPTASTRCRATPQTTKLLSCDDA